VLADRRQSLLDAEFVGAGHGSRDHVPGDAMAVVAVAATVGERGPGRLPPGAKRLLVGAQLVEQVVVDVERAHTRRCLGVYDPDHAVGQVHVGAIEPVQLADPQTAERERRDDRSPQRRGAGVGTLGVLDASRRHLADSCGDRRPPQPLGAQGDDQLAKLVGAGALAVKLAGGFDQRPRLVKQAETLWQRRSAILYSSDHRGSLTAGRGSLGNWMIKRLGA